MAATPKESLKDILDWLAGTDEAGWEQQIELGEECRSEMERMARPDYHRGRGRRMAQGPQTNPDAPRLNRAIPHVRAMLHAMRSRNRAAALEHGRLALAGM
jgi:hypothetical protein